MVDIVQIFQENFKSVDDLTKYNLRIIKNNYLDLLLSNNWEISKLSEQELELFKYCFYSDIEMIYHFLRNIELVNYQSVFDRNGDEIALISFSYIHLVLNLTKNKLISIGNIRTKFSIIHFKIDKSGVMNFFFGSKYDTSRFYKLVERDGIYIFNEIFFKSTDQNTHLSWIIS